MPATLQHPWRGAGAGRGFTLLEALVALALVAISLMGLMRLYSTLSRGEDDARQRGEAVLLAQDRLEQLRSYTSIDGASNSWNTLASGSDTASSNTSFTRRWTLGGASTDPMRAVSVQMSWTDRAGGTQQFSLDSVISRTDPADVGLLGFPLPANTTLKRPKNRNLNIPVPASDLGNGESAFRLPNTNYAVVFSNESGYVVKTCSLTTSSSTITLADLSGCATAYAYIVAGYISLDGVSSFPSGLAVNTASLTGTSSVTCSVSNAVDQSTGTAISGYQYYLCVVAVPSAGAPWSGTVRLAAGTLNAGSGGSSDRLVCRFQFPAAAGITNNMRNVQPYSAVTESLDSQNYVITNANSCPTVSGLATTLHQDCRNSNAQRGTACPAS
ncbi:prepilin-type N-terminal cleavage/methylation domain-containing protein [Ideonella sp. DXS22W]|uniref:Prepilin-type N-terminal cleavage/methylation domain-containing protein n=1 Tax=Pseudaquabacterium inlustre TaxID=2984192 RepID=A0ABU9CF06_9BURK